MKKIVNWSYDRTTDSYTISKDWPDFDKPTAVLDTDQLIKVPVIAKVRNQQGIQLNVVFDRTAYEVKCKRFFLVVNKETGEVFENEYGQPFWFPKETDVHKLFYDKARDVILLREDSTEPTEEVKTEEEAKAEEAKAKAETKEKKESPKKK